MVILKAISIRKHEVRNIIYKKRLRNNQIKFLSINLISFLKILSY